MTFSVGGTELRLKVDSGADVNVLTQAQFAKMPRALQARLRESKIDLRDYGGNRIGCTGCVTLPVVRAADNEIFQEEFYVVTRNLQPILSFQTATRLKVLSLCPPGGNIHQVEKEASEESDADEIALSTTSDRFPTFRGIKPVKLAVDKAVKPKIVHQNLLPIAMQEFVQSQWNEYKRQEIIEPVEGTPVWLSRVDVVAKKNGKHRIIIDMRPPNKAIVRRRFPMPNPEELQQVLEGSTHFAKTDATNAYFHVPLHKDSRYLTAFMTAEGPMQFTRLCFGINSAPELFQEIMMKLFYGLEGIVIYLDDILVHAPSSELLQKRLEAVKKRAAKVNLTLNEEKGVDEATEIEFLGMLITKDGCRPSLARVEGITNFTRPETCHDLREFTGLVNYIGKHLYGLSTLMAPLSELLRGNAKLLKGHRRLEGWGPRQDEAFESVKKAVADHVFVRGFFNRDHDTELMTDASPVGISAILTQRDPQDPESIRVIACSSRALTDTEKRYPQIQREALAAVYMMEKFYYYLLGIHFVLASDCEPLAFIMSTNKKRMCKRMITTAEQWATRIAQFDFTVRTITSAQNEADSLSRNPDINAKLYGKSKAPRCVIETAIPADQCEDEVTIAMVQAAGSTQAEPDPADALTPSEIKEASGEDEEMQKLLEVLQKEMTDFDGELASFARFRNELWHRDGIVYRGHRRIVPKALRKKALAIAHRSHPGISITKSTLRSCLWWPGMDSDTEQFVRDCGTCVKLSQRNPPEPLIMSKQPSQPWTDLAIDFWSGKETDPKVLVIADYYSKAIKVKIMKETTAAATIKALKEVFDEWGYPSTIKHDNGPQLVSEELQNWFKANDIKSLHTTPRDAQENGLVESRMKGVTKAIQTAAADRLTVEQALLQYQNDYNSRPHTITRIPPATLLLKRALKGRLPQARGEDAETLASLACARDRNFKENKKSFEDDKRRAKESPIEAGDLVYLFDHERSHKTAPHFKDEVFKVLEKKEGRLSVESMRDGRVFERKVTSAKLVPPNEHDGTGKLRNERPQEQQGATSPPPAPAERPKRTTAGKLPARFLCQLTLAE